LRSKKFLYANFSLLAFKTHFKVTEGQTTKADKDIQFRENNYFFDGMNLERRDERIFFIGFTSGFGSIKGSCFSEIS
jgi:hypothetical protein